MVILIVMDIDICFYPFKSKPHFLNQLLMIFKTSCLRTCLFGGGEPLIPFYKMLLIQMGNRTQYIEFVGALFSLKTEFVWLRSH
jgi:hypothetical protein